MATSTYKLQVNSAKVSGTHTDFPAYVDLSNMPASFWSTVTNGGGDIRAYSDSALTTQLPREVVTCDTATDTGELRVKTGLSTTTEIYITVDGTSTEPLANATYGKYNTWNSNYKAVYHMKDANDSTVNQNNGTVNGATSGATGQIGEAYSFDGSNDYITVPNSTELVHGTGDFSHSAWFKTTTTGARVLVAKGSEATGNRDLWSIITYADGTVGFRISDVINGLQYDATTTTTYNDGNRHLARAVRDNGTLRLYIDGVQKATVSETTKINLDGIAPLVIGNFSHLVASTYFLGTTDQHAHIDGIVSSDYALTEYNNQSDVDTFWTISEVITKTYKLQVNSAKVSGTHTDYPAYVDLGNMPASFWSTVSNGGGDIRVYSNENLSTQLPREVVTCDTSDDSGELRVKTGLSTTTEIYITVDGTSTEPLANATYGKYNTWNSNYKAVYHMKDANDSTSNGHDGTVSGATSGATGQIGDAYSFDGNNDYISIPSSVINQAEFSVRFIENTDTDNYGYYMGDSNDPANFFIRSYDDAGNDTFSLGLGDRDFTSETGTRPSEVFGTTYLHHITHTSGGEFKRYINGALQGTVTGSNFTGLNNALYLGNRQDLARDLAGWLDDINIVYDVYSSDRVSTENNNLMDVSTFWTITEVLGNTGNFFMMFNH